MSIVAYYARLSSEQLARCVENPQKLASGAVDDMPGAEVIDVDGAWEPLAWLVSPCKRIEQAHNTLFMSEIMSERQPAKPSFVARIARLFQTKSKQKTEPFAASKESLRKADEAQVDLPLVAIEGRTEVREEQLNFGMGAAALFPPEQVVNLRQALAAVSVQAIEAQYKPALMDQSGVFPEHWVEEGRDLMDNYILPNFEKLQRFYSKAAELGQTVLVWYS
ncbi:MAG: DUF1877 family protein [Pseudomonadota bacterium]|nr:DUF1877 family protein [Pseudomonadota bacterium]